MAPSPLPQYIDVGLFRSKIVTIRSVTCQQPIWMLKHEVGYP